MFEWDEAKNRANCRKHEVSFEIAALVFDDPFALTQRDQSSAEERFLTLGAIGPGAILFVVHLSYEKADGQEAIRIISARPATAREKKSYAEAYKKAAIRSRQGKGQTRRRHRSV
jgi:uncharacterized protein